MNIYKELIKEALQEVCSRNNDLTVQVLELVIQSSAGFRILVVIIYDKERKVEKRLAYKEIAEHNADSEWKTIYMNFMKKGVEVLIKETGIVL